MAACPRWRGTAQTKRGIIQGAERLEKWMKAPKPGKTRAVVVRSKRNAEEHGEAVLIFNTPVASQKADMRSQG